MATESMTIPVPETLARELDSLNQDYLLEVLERGVQALKIERALERYARGNISFGAAARLADVSQSELARHAHMRGMEPPFSAETVAEELGATP